MFAVTTPSSAMPDSISPTAIIRPSPVVGAWSPYPTVVIVVKDHHTASPSVRMFPCGDSRSTDSTASEPNISSPITAPTTYVVSWICGAIRALRPTSSSVDTRRSSRRGWSIGRTTAHRSGQWRRTNCLRCGASASRIR